MGEATEMFTPDSSTLSLPRILSMHTRFHFNSHNIGHASC